MTLPNLESDLLPTPTFAEVQAKELTHPHVCYCCMAQTESVHIAVLQ
jgi:hypothetical protein